MYLVIDEEYRLYKTPKLSGSLRSECKKGNLSIVRLFADQSKDGPMTLRRVQKAEGMNIDGTWSEIQDWSE